MIKSLSLERLTDIPSSVYHTNKTLDLVPVPYEVEMSFIKDNQKMFLSSQGILSGGKLLYGSSFGNIILAYSRYLNRVYIEWHGIKTKYYIVDLNKEG